MYKFSACTVVSVLACRTGTSERPVNAVQGEARARLKIRHTVDVPAERFLPALRRHLDEKGFDYVAIEPMGDRDVFKASRSDPDAPWPQFVAQSMERTTGAKPNVIPNSSGDRKSVVEGKSVAVRVDLGGRLTIKQ